MRFGRWVRGAAVVAVLVALVPEARAQTLVEGELHGILVDAGGAPVPDAIVAAVHRATGLTREARTGRDGAFAMTLLPAGVYDLRLERLGFHPLVVTGVEVVAGSETRMEAVATAVGAEPVRVDSVAFARVRRPAGAAGLDRVVAGGAWRDAPGRPDLGEISAAAGLAEDDLVVDGLPAGTGTVFLDGVPYERARHAYFDGLGDGRLGLPRLALGSARVSRGALDVAWAGAAGASWNLVSRPAPLRRTLESYASVHRGAEDGGGDPHLGFDAGALAGGRLSEAVSVLFALEGGMERTAAFSPWAASGALAELEGVLETRGIVLPPLGEPPVLEATSVAALAGVDWRRGQSVLRTRARLSASRAGDDVPGLPWTAAERLADGTDAGLSASLATPLGSRWTNELHVGIQHSGREYPAGPLATLSGGRSALVPETVVLSAGAGIGADPRLAGDFRRTGATLSDVALLRLPGHRLRVGGEVSVARHAFDFSPGATGRLVFGGVEEFRAQRGSYTEIVRASEESRFTVARVAAFAQDEWAMGSGFELLVGLRGEVDARAADEPAPEPEWFALTGTTAELPPTSEFRVLPRVGLTWAPPGAAGWAVHAAGGVYGEEMDPGVLDELYSGLGTTRVRRGIGSFTGWPAAPDVTEAPDVGSRLALADPDLASPRTVRGTFAVSGPPWSGATLRLAARYRWTDRLPRHADLNLLPAPAGRDQYGRPLFGRLVQQGAFVGPEPGSNRRFADVDVVSLVRSDGESRFLGFTASLEQRSTWLDVFGSYTVSRTVDNWPTNGVGAFDPEVPLAPVLDDEGAWFHGRSDFDVPVRAVLGAEARLPVPGGARLGGMYRYRSGRPFTAGFQPGVDVNGDGVAGNDPAYLDPSLPGFADVAGRWPCLEGGAGFAERNACRLPGVSALDLRLTVPVVRGGALYFDVLDLVGEAEAVPDRALYLVDRDATLAVDPDTGVATVPLVVNPRFGSPIVERLAPRTLRVGFRMEF